MNNSRTPTPGGGTPGFRRFVPYAILVVFALLLLSFFLNSGSGAPVPLSQVLVDAKSGKISQLEVKDGQSSIIATYSADNKKVQTNKESNANITTILHDAGIDYSADGTKGVKLVVQPDSGFGFFSILQLVFLALPVLFIVYFIFAMRRGQQGANSIFSFGNSKARVITNDRPSTTFADVAGCDEAKLELTEVVEFLKDPTRFTKLGATIPKGVLLVGPPGTGKTLLARAVAGEAGVPFYSISGSEFVEMFVGVGASRVRDLFTQAKTNAPAIIFIDEIDAVGRSRGVGLGGGNDEREQTLNQILVEMDGFEKGQTVIVVASTNRPDVLDQALLRPGRFDRRVMLGLPDLAGRASILAVHSKGKPISKEVDMMILARLTAGFSGADIANLLNEAAIQAARRGGADISMLDLEEAIDRVAMGPARKSRIISDEEKSMTAYHELGHAVVARMLPNTDPVQKITIVSRGMAGGFTRTLPETERGLVTQAQFEDRIAMAMGGYAAEKIFFKERTTGPSNDFEQASNIAREMVTRYGMSDKLGTLVYGQREDSSFLGRSYTQEQRNYSEEIAAQIDEEVKTIIDRNLSRAMDILQANEEKVHAIAQVLIEKETLDAIEFEALFDSPRPLPVKYSPRNRGDSSRTVTPVAPVRPVIEAPRPTPPISPTPQGALG